MKFINLFVKELKELITLQMLASLVIILSLLSVMGSVMNDAISKAVKENNNPKINISDLDDTDFTRGIIESMKADGAEVNIFTADKDDYAATLSKNNIKNIVIIPEGFTDCLNNHERPEIIKVERMTSASTLDNISSGSDSGIIYINKYISNAIASNSGMIQEDFELIQNPVIISQNTVIDDKSANISVDSVVGKISMQNMLIPIILLFLIMTTSNSLISSISNEKIDKTLETLLSAPVSRTAIISAKMLASAVVAIINSVVYMFGFSRIIKNASAEANGVISGIAGETLSVDDAIAQLGLSLSAGDYILVGIQLFLTIMICLSISIMLGALVNDTKSSQTVTLPIIMLAMIPYGISMIADVNNLPLAIRIIVYAIPFTHTFSSIPNLMFGNTRIFFIGMIYQVVVFLLCMFFALKLFNSDKILTISLNFGQKTKYKNKSKE